MTVRIGLIAVVCMLGSTSVLVAQSGLYFSEDGNSNGLWSLNTSTGASNNLGVTGVTTRTVGLAPSSMATHLFGSSRADLHQIRTDGSGFGNLGGADCEGMGYHRSADILYATRDGAFFTLDSSVGGQVNSLPNPSKLDYEGIAFDIKRGLVWALVGGGSGDTTLYAYEPTSQIWSKMFDTQIDWHTPGLAHDPKADLLYVKDTVTSALISIDPNTGNLQKVGDTRLSTGGGLAYVTQPVSLESNLYQLKPADQVAMTSYDGMPGGLVMLFAVEVNGIPIFSKVGAGRFDAQGVWSFGGTVPGGLSRTQVTMVAMGFSAPGTVGISNELLLTFN